MSIAILVATTQLPFTHSQPSLKIPLLVVNDLEVLANGVTSLGRESTGRLLNASPIIMSVIILEACLLSAAYNTSEMINNLGANIKNNNCSIVPALKNGILTLASIYLLKGCCQAIQEYVLEIK